MKGLGNGERKMDKATISIVLISTIMATGKMIKSMAMDFFPSRVAPTAASGLTTGRMAEEI